MITAIIKNLKFGIRIVWGRNRRRAALNEMGKKDLIQEVIFELGS